LICAISTGTSALSQVQSFTTQGSNANGSQGQSNLQATCANVTANSFDVTWTTPQAGSSVVKFGTDQNNLSQMAQAPWGQSNHKVTVNNLQPNTTYFVQAQTSAEQGTGAQQMSGIVSCTTKSQ